MMQQKIDAFMADLKALSEKHGMFLNNPFDERIDLLDADGDMVARDINIEEFQAEPWVEPVYELRVVTGPVLKMEQAAEMLGNMYAKTIEQALREPSPLYDKLFKGGN